MKLDEKIFNEMINIDVNKLVITEQNFDDWTIFGALANGFDESIKKENINEDIWMAFQSGITFELINTSGVLYQALLKYYKTEEQLLKKVRGSIFIKIKNEKFLIWHHGDFGYDFIDSDLLNGNGNGMTKKEFLEIINK